MSGGAVVGLVALAIVLELLLCVGTYALYNRWRKRRSERKEEPTRKTEVEQ